MIKMLAEKNQYKRCVQLSLFIILLCVFFSGYSFAQTLKRQSLSTLGGTSFGEGYQIRQTIGQSSNTERFSADNKALRQGFQQPSAIKGKIKECESCDLSVFPNPIESSSQLNIPLQSLSYSYGVYDFSGREVSWVENQNAISQTITNQNISSGQYLVKVIYSSGCFCSKKIIIK